MIVGIDEVGRGPWAGPLVMGAVVLGCEIEGLTDSKKLSKKRREELDVEIRDKALAVGLGWVDATEIDTLGLALALQLACRRALEEVDALGVAYSEIIIDGTVNFLAGTGRGPYVTTLKKADWLIPSVSAASIVAKVARDNYMTEQDATYPGYKFGVHVGYGTAAHRTAIEQLGVTPLHRLSFAPLQKYRRGAQHVSPNQSQSRLKNSPNTPVGSAELDQGLKQSSSRSGVFGLFLGTSRTDSTKHVSAPTTRRVGDASETAAANELLRLGHKILERNWKTKYCEIDIVSQKADTVYFTEVKHRKNDKGGDGLAAITSKKLAQMKFAARLYVHNNSLTDVDLRLVAIATTGELPTIVEIIELS